MSRYNNYAHHTERFGMKEVTIGIVGLGTVGGATVETLRAYRERSHPPLNLLYRLHAVCARSSASAKRVGVEELYRPHWRDVVSDPNIDIVVELIGGTTEAFELVMAALTAGKDVVTANKALLATHGPELFTTAREHNCALRFEAAVAGGIPIVHVLEHSLVAQPIHEISGILNGTTNYILTRMQSAAMSYAEALSQAQELGYAEADPTADVEGHDAAAKIGLLTSLATGQFFGLDQVRCQGISQVTSEDIAVAKRLGAVVKLIAQAQIHHEDTSSCPQVTKLQVAPYILPVHHPLAPIDGATNAVSVLSEGLNETVYIGAGAGAYPTASAVVADILALVSARSHNQEPGEALMRASACTHRGHVVSSTTGQASYLLRACLQEASSNLTLLEQELSCLPQVCSTAILEASEELTRRQLVVQTSLVTQGQLTHLLSKVKTQTGDGEASVFQLMSDELLLKG